MVNPDSDLYRQHPEWALQIAGRSMITARNQLVLNIALPEVSEYLFAKLDALLLSLPIRYLKWDHNRDLTSAALAGGAGAAGYRAQVLAVYQLLGRLRAAHPALEIESCSGGGGRIDFAILRHTHRVWGSDCIDALSRLDIQRGFGQFFPPEILGSHIGTAPAHTTGRSQSLAFRAAVAMTGHLGVELDVRHLDAAASQQLGTWIGRYKAWRTQLHQGRVWRGIGADGLVWQAHGDHSAQDLLLFVYRCAPSTHRYTPALRLPMVDASARYHVEQLVPIEGDGAVQTPAPYFAKMLESGVEMDGAWIQLAGLPMPRTTAETCFIVRLRKL
jgi:alpha-galactosidase